MAFEPAATREVELTVERIAAGGDGIAHLHGKVVFVTGGLPGERVEAIITEEHKRFVRARVLTVLQRAACRRDDDCPHANHEQCGGCGFRHVTDEEALTIKATAVFGELRKLAPAVRWPDPTLIPVEPHDGTRVRMRFHVEGGRVGLYRAGSHEVVLVPECRIAAPGILPAARLVEGIIRAHPQEPPPKSIVVEVAHRKCYVGWKGHLGAGAKADLQGAITEQKLAGVRAGKRGAFVLGEPWIPRTLRAGGRTFVFVRAPGSFGQATPAADRAMRDVLHGWLQALQPSRVTDLFAGAGNLSLVAASVAAHVDAVENDPLGLAGLRENIARNHLDHVFAHDRDLRDGLGVIVPGEVVILDPPRDGAKELVMELAHLRPKHIIYVSCGPGALARDTTILSAQYDVDEVLALDMFPRTPHLEVLVLLRRRSHPKPR